MSVQLATVTTTVFDPAMTRRGRGSGPTGYHAAAKEKPVGERHGMGSAKGRPA
ncbi:hypothetical protein P1J78_10880 [Psychromarinibacter sp. C21-152]|uniref:Uncharacterized protein n=1 Tax=Psychromarinibacter sediminicola TaxID=3033385 RepID=A0AAE3NRN9_9RHOB|nr:hypothetical protein [Psychromarinibacter sediminicola]